MASQPGDDQPKEKRLDYFADGEERFQASWGAKRSQLFGPILAPLRKFGVKPDHITLLGVAFLIPYAILFSKNPALSPVFLALYIICDGLDGVYARLTNTSNGGGALADIVADQLGMLLTTLLVIHAGLANPVLAAYYACAYITMIAFSVVQNYLGLPMQLILRSKYLLYGAVGAWVWLEFNAFFWLMAGFSITMTFNAGQSFLRIKKHLAQSDRL